MSDTAYMRRALELAELAWGETSPNPMVGALIVKNGRVIAEGYHAKDGGAHAEINCLNACKESPEGATMYVTLEPCTTKGRTGACSDAIINAKLSKLVIGAKDPNPAHSGRAGEIFKAAGLDCKFGVMEDECTELNFLFNHSIVKNEALLAIKCAISKDGKIAQTRGAPTAITQAPAREHLMKIRKLFSSIAVGTGTLLADNPNLSVRGFPKTDSLSCPLRLIFSESLNIVETDIKKFKVFSDSFADKTRIVTKASAPKERIKKLNDMGIDCMLIESEKSFWRELKKRLWLERINSILVEGGAEIFSSINAERAADFAYIYKSEKLLGEAALSAFESPRNFEFQSKNSPIKLVNDTLEFGKITYK